jgi:hypothetical protein
MNTTHEVQFIDGEARMKTTCVASCTPFVIWTKMPKSVDIAAHAVSNDLRMVDVIGRHFVGLDAGA